MDTLQTTQHWHSWGSGDKEEEEPFILPQTILAIPLETLETRNHFSQYNAHRRGL